MLAPISAKQPISIYLSNLSIYLTICQLKFSRLVYMRQLAHFLHQLHISLLLSLSSSLLPSLSSFSLYLSTSLSFFYLSIYLYFLTDNTPSFALATNFWKLDLQTSFSFILSVYESYVYIALVRRKREKRGRERRDFQLNFCMKISECIKFLSMKIKLIDLKIEFFFHHCLVATTL